MYLAQCDYSMHTGLGGCEIAQLFGRHTVNGYLDCVSKAYVHTCSRERPHVRVAHCYRHSHVRAHGHVGGSNHKRVHIAIPTDADGGFIFSRCTLQTRRFQKYTSSLCSPNEDFGRMNKWWDVDFRDTFQWIVAQIEYSHPLKVVRKDSSNVSFSHRKSSFG